MGSDDAGRSDVSMNASPSRSPDLQRSRTGAFRLSPRVGIALGFGIAYVGVAVLVQSGLRALALTALTLAAAAVVAGIVAGGEQARP